MGFIAILFQLPSKNKYVSVPNGCKTIKILSLALWILKLLILQCLCSIRFWFGNAVNSNYRWDGDECGVEFSVSSMLPKTNNDVALYYPSCNHVIVEALSSTLAPLPVHPLPVASSTMRIVLSKHLTSIIE